MTASPGPEILTASRVSKRFGITQALDDVTVAFRAGEVHALMGENGAGKSTLGKVIAGLYRQDSGLVTITDVSGSPRVLKAGSLEDAFAAGVRLVHQELAQCPNLSVAENLGLHALPTRGGLVDFGALEERAARLVHRLDPGIDVRAPLGSLGPGRRQICQIAASLDDRTSGNGHGGRPRVIVFDEPTSSLSVAEADRLMEITRQLAGEGITIIYVSHRMGEIFQVCDRVTVLRDGKFVATSCVRDIDEPTLVEQMIGRRLATPTGRISVVEGETHHDKTTAPVRLEANAISSPGKLRDVSLRVHEGEILGVGGLVGAGRSELLDALFGLDPAARGGLNAEGAPMPLGRPRDAIRRGIGYVPEDRRLQGLFFLLGVDENIVMPFMPRLAGILGVRRRRAEHVLVRDKLAEFRVKTASTAATPAELSGGNQQKLLIARWMGRGTRVLLLDEPTRGIDVGTKHEIYRIVRTAADSGLSVILVSSEMPELLALSDRIIVMCEGRLTGELRGGDMTQANILRLATRNT